jgi:hypothetical protein
MFQGTTLINDEQQFHYKLVWTDNPLVDFVYSFSSLQNISDITEGDCTQWKVDLIFQTMTINFSFR